MGLVPQENAWNKCYVIAGGFYLAPSVQASKKRSLDQQAMEVLGRPFRFLKVKPPNATTLISDTNIARQH